MKGNLILIALITILSIILILFYFTLYLLKQK
jgi:hypothetical protein